MDRSSSAREYVCVADWGKWTIFIEKAMQEVAEKLKNWEYADMRKDITKNNKDWKNFLRSMIRNHEQWVNSSTILTFWAVMTYLRSSSSSHHLEFKIAEPRSWNAAKYTWGYEYSWERFRLSTCSSRSWWITQMIQEIWRHYWLFWEQKELTKVGAKNHCNQYLYLVLW